MRIFPTIASVAAAALLTGCATLSSTSKASNDATADTNGLTYFLPMRLMKVTATRAPVDIEKLKKDSASAKAKMEAAVTAHDEAKAKREALDAILKKLTAGSGAHSEAQTQRDRAAAEEDVAREKREAATAAYEQASGQAVAAEATGAKCTVTMNVELLPAQADPGQRYIARMLHNPLRDDAMTLKVSAAGLLSSTNVVATDRTGDILVEAAGASAALDARAVRTLASVENKAAPPEKCTSLPRQVISIFDPVTELSTTNAKLAKAQFPFQLATAIYKTSGGVAMTVPPVTSRVSETSSNGFKKMLGQEAGGRFRGAIYYRSAVPVVVTLEQCPEEKATYTTPHAVTCEDDSWTPMGASIAMLPQAGPVTFIPMNSSIFVKTVNDVQFTEGTISSWSADRPSEVLEVVRLPVKILTAVVSVPAQLLSLRVDYSSKDESLIGAQQSQIEAAERLRILKACLDRAQGNDQSATACLSD